MNIYLITQDAVREYDIYDSAVVGAETELEARMVHPGGGSLRDDQYFKAWPSNPKDVRAELIGVAFDGQLRGVVCASYNAG